MLAKKSEIAKVVGGIGEKKSNKGTQYFLQNRIYKGKIALAITTCCNPYYITGDFDELTIKKDN